MSKAIRNEYIPDYVSPPGDTLLETIEDLGMSQAELARRTGRPLKTINEIIKGKTAITPETALQLELVLGIPASFWNNREQQYREALARQAEQQQLPEWIPWLQEIPLKALIRRKLVPACKDKAQQVLEALKFFGVASPGAWCELYKQEAVAFRQATSSNIDEGAVAAWLREGELKAREIDCAPYDAHTFRAALADIKKLTVDLPADLQTRLTEMCSQAGVALILVEELPRTGICGATRWLSPSKALIQLSLRYKRDDSFWFTLYHEAGHVLLHGKRDVFLESAAPIGDKEDQASRFAENHLIPLREWEDFIATGHYRSHADILAFAQAVDIGPGIVVGRLQFEGRLPYTHCNALKRPMAWAEEGDDEAEGRAECRRRS